MGQMLVLESTVVASMAVLHPEQSGTEKPMQTAIALMSLPSTFVFFSKHSDPEKSKDVWLWLQLRNYTFT